MEFPPVKRTSISDEITRRILKMILQNEIQPGERLPSERNLAQRFNTNRNTLREAIRNLQTLNVVTARQGDGLRVLNYRETGEVNLIPYFLQDVSGFKERVEVVRDMLEFRRLLLSEVAARIVDTATEEDFRAMDELVEVQRNQKDEPEELVKTDLEFSYRLVKSARSIAFGWLFNTFGKLYRDAAFQFPSLFVFTPRYPEPLQRIVDAARDGDREVVRRLMQEHLASSDAMILGALKNLEEMLD